MVWVRWLQNVDLGSEGTSFKIIAETTITRLPIRVLATKSNGWHDITIMVAGGGIQPGYEAVLFI